MFLSLTDDTSSHGEACGFPFTYEGQRLMISLGCSGVPSLTATAWTTRGFPVPPDEDEEGDEGTGSIRAVDVPQHQFDGGSSWIKSEAKILRSDE